MPQRFCSIILLGACLAIMPLSASANGDDAAADDMQQTDSQGVEAQGAAALRGHQFVQEKCSNCHAIDKTGDSPFAAAPPLREIKTRYPLEGLEEAFAEGIVVGHPAMPEFQLDPDQIADLIAYLDWLGE